MSQDPPGTIFGEECKDETLVNSNQTPLSRIKIKIKICHILSSQHAITPQNIYLASMIKTFKKNSACSGTNINKYSVQGVKNKIHSTQMHDVQTNATMK